MESVAKVHGTIHGGQVVTDGLPFAEGEAVELMVWSPKADDLAPDPPAQRTPEAREAALRASIDRVRARHP